MRAQLSSLPPLQPANMSAVMKEAPDGSLYRRTDLLLNNLLKMSAGLRVVDISGKTSGELPLHHITCSNSVPTDVKKKREKIDERENNFDERKTKLS